MSCALLERISFSAVGVSSFFKDQLTVSAVTVALGCEYLCHTIFVAHHFDLLLILLSSDDIINVSTVVVSSLFFCTSMIN